MTGVEVRLARPEEYAEAGRITADAYLADALLHHEDPYGDQLADAADRAERAELWVATGSGALLGTVTFAPLGSPYREIGRHDEGEFRMLGVAPRARGRGVGRALAEHCLERSRELGYAGVRVSSLPAMTSAHRLYARLGFARSPDDDWSPAPGVLLWAFALRFGERSPGGGGQGW